MTNFVQAVGADPVFLGNLVAAHIKASYPEGIVLLCAPDSDGFFPTVLLQEAFGEDGTRDICNVGNLAVVRFPAGTTPGQVAEALREAGETVGEDGGFTIYENGEVAIDEVLG